MGEKHSKDATRDEVQRPDKVEAPSKAQAGGQDHFETLFWKAERLLRRWLVLYNPLYLFSALCVLGGVLMVSESLDQDSRQGEIWLMAVMELYEVLLIGGAALLYRMARLSRPAVILALLEVLFIADVTLQAEAAATMRSGAILATACWLALFVFKLNALAWALRLRLSLSARILPALGAAGVVLFPTLLFNHVTNKEVTGLLMVWFAGLVVAAVVWIRPRVESNQPLDARGQEVLRKITSSAWILWALFLSFHIVSWSVANDLPWNPLQLTPLFLLAALLSKKEAAVWGWTAATLALTLSETYALSSTAFLAGLLLCWKAHWRDLPRMYVGSIFCGYLGVLAFSWVSLPIPTSPPLFWLDLTAAALLCALAWWQRLPSASLAALGMMLKIFFQYREASAGLSTFQWGVLLLGVGFSTLLVGILVNWKLRSALTGPEFPPKDLSRGPYR